MLKLEQIIFDGKANSIDKIIAEYFEVVNFGTKISDPLFPRKINLSLKNDHDSEITFCDLEPRRIYGYRSSGSLALYFFIDIKQAAKENLGKVIGQPIYMAELSAENTDLFNTTLFNWHINQYEVYLRPHAELDEKKNRINYHLITVTNLQLKDLYFPD